MLFEHVRERLARLDAGEIDAFDLDELIHRYKRSAREALDVLRAKRFGLAVRGSDAPIPGCARERIYRSGGPPASHTVAARKI